MKSKIIAIITITIFLSSCSTTKYLSENQKIVTKIKITITQPAEGITPSKLKRYVQQPELDRLFGIPIYTYIYNIPDPAKDRLRKLKKQKKLQKINQKIAKKYDTQTTRIQAKRNKYLALYRKFQNKDTLKAQKYYQKFLELDEKLSERRKNRPKYLAQNKKQDIFTWWEFLRKIGSPPPIYYPALAQKSATYIKNYLASLGYYNAKVSFKTIDKGKHKIVLEFIVDPDKPIIIDSVKYNIQDPKIKQIILSNPNLQLKKGTILSISNLQNYRNHIVSYLKERGFYYFAKSYIYFDIDTTIAPYKALVIVHITNPTDRFGNPIPHRQFSINKIQIFTDYNPNLAMDNPQQFFSNLDTLVLYKNKKPYYFIKKYDFVVKPKYILKEIYLRPGQLYKFSDVTNTYSHISKFEIYKLVNIDFTEIDSNKLDCNIQLTPTQSQSIALEIVGTNSSATIGGAINLTYKHRNLFKGGEVLSLKFFTSLESQKVYFGTGLDSIFNFNTQEYGIDLQITFPRLLVPFKLTGFIARSNPKTVVRFSYSFRDRPEYNRIDLTGTFSYYWKANIFTNHVLTPVRISSVRVWDMLPEFEQLLISSFLRQSYEDYFIFGTTYSFTFTNQGRDKPITLFFQTNFSSSGNLLYEIMKLTNQPKIDGSYYVPGFKTTFAQFVKFDFDLRLYQKLYQKNTLVWRIFAGVGVPYLNSKLMPFGERYFAGGSNSIRAWQVRTLGPGSYKLPEDVKYPNQTGDIKLEANIEYRYPIIWKLEGAMFLDAGNIWAINKYDTRPGALFQWNEFYKQIAIGTGTGIRLNFDFFVIRLDLGVKLYDPSAPEGQRFIPAARPFNINDFVINIAIGYPF